MLVTSACEDHQGKGTIVKSICLTWAVFVLYTANYICILWMLYEYFLWRMDVLKNRLTLLTWSAAVVLDWWSRFSVHPRESWTKCQQRSPDSLQRSQSTLQRSGQNCPSAMFACRAKFLTMSQARHNRVWFNRIPQIKCRLCNSIWNILFVPYRIKVRLQLCLAWLHCCQLTWIDKISVLTRFVIFFEICGYVSFWARINHVTFPSPLHITKSHLVSLLLNVGKPWTLASCWYLALTSLLHSSLYEISNAPIFTVALASSFSLESIASCAISLIFALLFHVSCTVSISVSLFVLSNVHCHLEHFHSISTPSMSTLLVLVFHFIFGLT